MADYPDWVLKHKQKGTYINRVGDKYYLYAAHSERVPGTNKVRRVSDGYIGRITEQEGLIPVRDSIKGVPRVYECGLCMTLLSLCDDVHRGLRRIFRGATERILVAGLLSVAYGEYSKETYQWSFLSVRFPGLDMDKTLTDKQSFGVQRCARMITELVRKQYGDDAALVMARLSRVCVVHVNGKYYLPEINAQTKTLLSQQQIDWRDWLG